MTKLMGGLRLKQHNFILAIITRSSLNYGNDRNYSFPKCSSITF